MASFIFQIYIAILPTMADGAGGGSDEEKVDYDALGAKPKTKSKKEAKEERKRRKWQFGGGEDESEEESGKGKERREVKMEVVGGRGQEVTTITRSSRARWARGYESEEAAWLVGNEARRVVKEERRQADFARAVREARGGIRLDVADRLAQFGVEGEEIVYALIL